MEKTLENDSQGLRSLAGITPVLALGLLCFSARIISRVTFRYRLNASDYVNTSAVVVIVVAYAFFVASIHKGLGRHIQFITHENIAVILRYLFFMKFLGTCGVTLTRLSIALQLLPLSAARAWKAALWGIIALQVASLVALILYDFVHVRPVSKNWDISSFHEGVTVGYAFIGISVFGDVLCTIMPLFLIWDLSRSKLERCLLSMLSALGLFAAAAAISTLIWLSRLGNSTDPLRTTVQIYTWCLVEQVSLIVASSAPLLKGPIERVLTRLHFPGFHNIPRELGEFSSNDVSRETRWHITRIWRKRHGSTSPSQDTTVAPKNSGCNSDASPSFKTNASSTFDPSSTGTTVSIQIEDLERSRSLS